MNSLSSSLMLGTTLYRNQPGILNKVHAQVGYALITVIAAVEVFASAFFAVLSFATIVVSDKVLERSFRWLGVATFSFFWAITYFIQNPFQARLIADEKTALSVPAGQEASVIPPGALTQLP